GLVLDQALQLFELIGVTLPKRLQGRLVSEAMANAVFFVNQPRRQGPRFAEFRKPFLIEGERDKLTAPPTDFQIGLDELFECGRAQWVVARGEVRRQVNVVGVLPGFFELVSPLAELFPVIGQELSQIGRAWHLAFPEVAPRSQSATGAYRKPATNQVDSRTKVYLTGGNLVLPVLADEGHSWRW